MPIAIIIYLLGAGITYDRTQSDNVTKALRAVSWPVLLILSLVFAPQAE